MLSTWPMTRPSVAKMRIRTRLSFVVLLLVFGLVSARKSYEGYKVLETTPTTNAELRFLHDLEKDTELDFWLEPTSLHATVQVMVPPAKVAFIQRLMKQRGLAATVVNENVQRDLDAEREKIEARRANRVDLFQYDYSNFNDLDVYLNEIDALAADCPSGFTCQVSQIGATTEDRPMKQLRVFKTDEPDRKAFWVDAQIHAREWLSGATVMNVINRLIREYGTNTEATNLMDTYNWYFLPMMNPDGYNYTWAWDRMWRKSRNANPGSSCLGVDLNRNYNYEWGGIGTSGNPCSNLYRGASAASQPETQSIQDEAARVAANLHGWLTVHTYGQYILTPWGNSESGACLYPPDYDDIMRVANAQANAIEATWGTTWRRGNACQILYAFTGNTQDYMKGVHNVPYPFTPELRGPGFTPGPEYIPFSFDEFWNGLVAYVDAAANP